MTGTVHERVERLLGALTLDEKAALVAGVDLWHTPAIDRLDIPALKVTDGPNGARGARWSGNPSVCVPCGTALAATWDPALVREVGRLLGVEARRKGAHVLLAPTVNVHRHPLAGRNFECHSEDPYLSARLAVAYVEGVQSQGVGCAVKHFVANDSEFERMTISSEVDERTLREISLVPFEAAVREAGAWSLMSAYNRLRGTYCSEHPWLLTELLKEEWGFDGVVVSDWFGTHSTAEAARAGLDFEMPGPPAWFGPKLAAAVRGGEVDEAVLDDKVRRMLLLMDRTGALDGTADDEQVVDDPDERALVRRAAAEGFVLLRNESATLPLDDLVRTVAVIGGAAAVANVHGGGSAALPHHEAVTPLAGIRVRAGDEVAVHHARGAETSDGVPALDGRALDGRLVLEYFAGRDLGGEVVFTETQPRGHLQWLGAPAPGVPVDCSLRVTGALVPTETGEWTLALVQTGRARLRLDGEVVVDNWEPVGRSELFFGAASAPATAGVALEAGRRYALEVEYRPPAPGYGGLRIGCRPPQPDELIARAVEVAVAADAAVVVVGTDAEWETEGHDRTSFDLPGGQQELIAAVAAANPRTVVVVNTGAPVAMPWADDVPAVLQCFFAGEEWGNALADVLFGDVNPSGKLPTTFPVRLEDTPAFTSYPGARGEVRYGEGVFVGYRWYDARAIEPRFCFGHGLSYTTFALGPPSPERAEVPVERLLAGDDVTITVPVTNTGPARGAEVVQAYVHHVAPSVARPPQELKAFAKVALDPGETRTVALRLDRRAFAWWDVRTDDWTVEAGDYEVRIGTSSRDLRRTVAVTLA